MRLRGAEPLGSDHGGHDRRAAAGLPDAALEVLGHAEVVPILDGAQSLVVQLHGVVVGMEVGEIGAGYDERVAALDFASQREAELAAGLVALIAHDDGDQLEVADGALEERKLVFEGVLAAVTRDHVAARGELNRVAAHDLLAEGLVDGHGSERRLVGFAVEDGDEGEAIHVRRRDDHDAVVVPALHEGVAVGSDCAREVVAGVRRDQGLDGAFERRGRGVGDQIVHRFGEDFGVGWVEGAGDGGGAHLGAGAGGGEQG